MYPCPHVPLIVPRLSLSVSLNVAHVNIMCEKLKERESLVQNCTYPWPFSIELLPYHYSLVPTYMQTFTRDYFFTI